MRTESSMNIFTIIIDISLCYIYLDVLSYLQLYHADDFFLIFAQGPI